MAEDLRQRRDEVYDWIRSRLFCPGKVPGGRLNHNPIDAMYYSGVLFPKGMEERFEEEVDETGDPDKAEKKIKPETRYRRYQPPSSVGFSFLVPDGFVGAVVCGAVHFNKLKDEETKSRYWERVELDPEEREARPPADKVATEESHDLLNGSARLFLLWRPHERGWLVTVSLSNNKTIPRTSDTNDQEIHCLYEVSLECIARKGHIREYPLIDPRLQTEEEQELALRYREKRIFGIGHGAAVNWEQDKDGGSKIFIDWIPRFEAPKVTANLPEIKKELLQLSELQERTTKKRKAVLENLEAFADAYESWVESQEQVARNFNGQFEGAPGRIVKRQRDCLRRIREGIQLIRDDTKVAAAFRLAQQAMERQMQSDRNPKPQWRPFQLAFLLMAIPSVCDEDHPDRDVVDLIWFPTGGGKTEAYLGLIAIYIFHRRLRSKVGGCGTSVIMRYTLRLLTRQQFERAARLITMMEIIRRKHPDQLGHEPITAGLWVGEGTSPNEFKDAAKLADGPEEDWREVLPVPVCPSCRKPFGQGSLVADYKKFELYCRNEKCELHAHDEGGRVPLQSVDEGLYKEPPTLLFATVDKFALMAYDVEGRPSNFLPRMPPGLIIQDELHLVSSELGSVAALYEAGLDAAIQARGYRPKYIASTATIRNADRQVRQLYGRRAGIFPPAGLDADDSFFMRTVSPKKEDPSTWGRLYVGAISWFACWSAWDAITPLIAVMRSLPANRLDESSGIKDAWWTLLVYHTSIANLQRTRGLLDESVPEFLHKLRRFERELREDDESDQETSWDQVSRMDSDSILELWSGSAEQGEAQARLETGIDDNTTTGNRRAPVSVGLCTNMISVGIDIGRLASMIISSQPLTSAEYIQASSRVGRSDVPGIVLTHYLRTQARSLSHYEGFRQYHESMYRFVEPTSVAPFTPRCRHRALPAAFIIAMRYGVPGKLHDNGAAANFDPNDPEIARAIEIFRTRLIDACDEESHEVVSDHLNLLIRKWVERTKSAKKLRYNIAKKEKKISRLVKKFEENPINDYEDEWEVGKSMRSVDQSIGLKEISPAFDGGNRHG